MGQLCNKRYNMEAIEQDNLDEGEQEVEEEDGDESDEEENEENYEKDLPELRSLNCDIPCSAVFRSMTKRVVDVYWVDYKGKRVKYATLQPGKTYSIMTFETHPWIFRDANTGAILHGNGEEVFMPYSRVLDDEDGEDDDFTVTVEVGIPVYGLLQRCIEECSQLCRDMKVQEMELPVCLKMDLLTHQMNKNIPCSFYDRYEGD